MSHVKESLLNNIPFNQPLDPYDNIDLSSCDSLLGDWEDAPECGVGCAGGRI